MLEKTYNKLYNTYYHDYESLAIENGYHPDDDFEKIHEYMMDDLYDKGFSDEEIMSIIDDNIKNPKIAFKFVAYALLLIGYDFYDEESLIKILKDEGLYEDLTDDDIINIVMMRNEVDY